MNQRGDGRPGGYTKSLVWEEQKKGEKGAERKMSESGGYCAVGMSGSRIKKGNKIKVKEEKGKRRKKGNEAATKGPEQMSWEIRAPNDSVGRRGKGMDEEIP